MNMRSSLLSVITVTLLKRNHFLNQKYLSQFKYKYIFFIITFRVEKNTYK